MYSVVLHPTGAVRWARIDTERGSRLQAPPVRFFLFFAVLAAGAYAVVVASPVLQKYLAVQYAAQAVASHVAMEGRNHHHTRQMLDELKSKTGLELYSSAVTVTTEGHLVRAAIDVRFPVHMPGLDRTYEWRTQVIREARRR